MEILKKKEKNAVRLFGDNVMLEQRAKDTGGLILPDDAQKENQALFDIVVIGVGDEVKRVVVGDEVVATMPQSCAKLNPATGKICIIIPEAMIQGVLITK